MRSMVRSPMPYVVQSDHKHHFSSNQNLMHPGRSLQLSQAVYYSIDSYTTVLAISSAPRVCTLVLFHYKLFINLMLIYCQPTPPPIILCLWMTLFFYTSIYIYLLFTVNGLVVHVCDNVDYEVWGVISFSGHR